MIGGGAWNAIYDHGLDLNDLVACADGAIHMWQASSNFVRPNITVEGGHSKGTETGSMVFSVDGRTLLTRGGDDTVKRTLVCQSVRSPLISNSLGSSFVQKAVSHAI